ncbi:alpha/beta hydrolase [Pedobacter frigiditerrae]|uniref:Alpha/beta hydrolase n=1 Tax=Pedobacter frigiditerrae TaxID=2530452 RepID=A0A4R0MQP3_9SPHI|nr:alpha/beta hydrolase [Pedobacter frigiditerrae]TCC89219.1 alpha/beta hydrolase [Pedobacter frigiditerrae]
MKTQTTLRKTKLLATSLLLFFAAAGSLMAQGKQEAKNIVIVHGAFVDGSGWSGVYDQLKKAGYNVTIVQNPLTSLEDDVAATNRAIEAQDGPVILVGHSWGGVVITEAGNADKVVGLVYVAAFMPDAKQSAISLIQSGPQLPVNGILPPDKNGLLYFDKAKFRECFAPEQSVEKANFMADSQQPINVKSFLTPITTAAWKTKPTYAIVATADKSIHPDLERSMYKAANAKTIEIKGSHSLYISNPKAIADVILLASKGGK